MGSGILMSPHNPQLNKRKTGRSAGQWPRQLPITEFAHKAGNGRCPLAVVIDTARSARAQRRGNGLPHVKPICFLSRYVLSAFML